jgi:hypothetical protein
MIRIEKRVNKVRSLEEIFKNLPENLNIEIPFFMANNKSQT